jgi:uncharacterized membrane protein
MASKYDTNPLDPDFPAKAAAAAANGDTRMLNDSDAKTRPFAPAPEPDDEVATRVLNNAATAGYSAPVGGQYQTVGFSNMNQSISRKIDKIGLPENVLTALPYIPWYIGMVASLLILFLVPKSEPKVRFHAAQGLAAHIGVLIVSAILGFIANFTDLAGAGNAIFNIVTTIMFVIFAIRAWKGKPIHIESVDDLTNWLEEKITPSLANKGND